MKFVLLTPESSRETWSDEAFRLYTKKITSFVTFERVVLKSPSKDRREAEEKKRAESEALLQKLVATDYVVLCDEKGKVLTSRGFSEKIQQVMTSGKKRCVFVVGGAFGVSESVKARADYKMQLGGLTLNHLVAQTVLLEQIFRSMTIWKGIPYHND